jgi:hypothetical protein
MVISKAKEMALKSSHCNILINIINTSPWKADLSTNIYIKINLVEYKWIQG